MEGRKHMNPRSVEASYNPDRKVVDELGIPRRVYYVLLS